MSKKTIAIDFDGVLHAYTSAWTRPDEISDGPVPGAQDAVRAYLAAGLEVAVYSVRAETEAGRLAIMLWLEANGFPTLLLSATKPKAVVYLDDRAMRFDGRWPSPEEVLGFQPWNRRHPLGDDPVSTLVEVGVMPGAKGCRLLLEGRTRLIGEYWELDGEWYPRVDGLLAPMSAKASSEFLDGVDAASARAEETLLGGPCDAGPHRPELDPSSRKNVVVEREYATAYEADAARAMVDAVLQWFNQVKGQVGDPAYAGACASLRFDLMCESHDDADPAYPKVYTVDVKQTFQDRLL